MQVALLKLKKYPKTEAKDRQIKIILKKFAFFLQNIWWFQNNDIPLHSQNNKSNQQWCGSSVG